VERYLGIRRYDEGNMHDDTLWTVYANAVLQIGGTRQRSIDLRRPLSDEVRRELKALGLGARFAVITAFNPGGRRATTRMNQWRHLLMRAALMLSGNRFVAASGESPDGSHRERGFAVAMSRSDAAAMARRYGQLAQYWFDGEAFWLDGVLGEREPERLP
jgi:hypothetical protein